MTLTQEEFNQVIDLLVDAIVAKHVVYEVSRTPIDTASDKKEAAQALENYNIAIESLYEIHRESSTPLEANNVYQDALQTRCTLGRRSLDCVHGVNRLSANFTYCVNIDSVQKQLNSDFSSDQEIFSPLRYTGKHAVTSSTTIAPSISFIRSESLYAAVTNHPFAFFTQSDVGLCTIALGVTAVASYAFSN